MTQSVTSPAQPAQPEPIQPPVLENAAVLLASPTEILSQGKEVARAIKKYVRTDRSLQLKLDGKKYPYAPVWQFCAACFGVTPMITSTEELLTDDRKEMGYLSIAHAIDARGRVISGAEATCMCSETEWAGRPSFQLRSMAETRSVSKVLSNLYRWVMVLAGFAPTPAEEMGGGSPRPKRQQFKTQCGVSSCGNMISDRRRNQTIKKYGLALCLPCEQQKGREDGEKLTAPLNDPAQVAEYVAGVKAKKANSGQPIVRALNHADPTEGVA